VTVQAGRNATVQLVTTHRKMMVLIRITSKDSR
jgi:hypothetical protein